MLAREGMPAIWRLHVAAADADRRGHSSVAAMLIEIADAAEREWLLAAKDWAVVGLGPAVGTATAQPRGKS